MNWNWTYIYCVKNVIIKIRESKKDSSQKKKNCSILIPSIQAKWKAMVLLCLTTNYKTCYLCSKVCLTDFQIFYRVLLHSSLVPYVLSLSTVSFFIFLFCFFFYHNISDYQITARNRGVELFTLQNVVPMFGRVWEWDKNRAIERYFIKSTNLAFGFR